MTRKYNRKDSLGAFANAYIEAALWSSTDESDDSGGEPLDKNYSASDIADATIDKMIADCDDFEKRFGELIHDDDSPNLAKYGRTEVAGHDFWLSRNGHGANFADGDWPKHGDELQAAAESYGEFNLYVGDDGEIHGTPLDKASAREARGRGLPIRMAIGRVAAQRGAAEARRSGGPRLEALDFFRGQGFNAAQAKDLANAEQKSHKHGWRVDWEYDPGGIDSIGDIDPDTIKEILAAVLRDEQGNVLASLGSIVDPDRKYSRVVEAELALEALNDTSLPARTAREAPAHTLRDYIAVDKNDRRVAGPFKSRDEADRHVPPGGYVKFATAHRRGPPSPAPSAYPMFRAKETGGRTAATFTVETLESEDEFGNNQTWITAARRGPKMDNGPAVGLSLTEATELVEMLERTGSLARLVPEAGGRVRENSEIWIGTGKDAGPYEVHPSEGQWVVVNSQNGFERGHFQDKSDAVITARKLNKEAGGRARRPKARAKRRR